MILLLYLLNAEVTGLCHYDQFMHCWGFVHAKQGLDQFCSIHSTHPFLLLQQNLKLIFPIGTTAFQVLSSHMRLAAPRQHSQSTMKRSCLYPRII